MVVRRHPDYYEKRRCVIRKDLKEDPIVISEKVTFNFKLLYLNVSFKLKYNKLFVSGFTFY